MMTGKDKCCGCGSCTNACTQNCIKMTMDSEGFRYPVIDSGNCIHCRACEKVCPIINPAPLNDEPSALAVQNTDESVRQVSSSGGVFTALAQDVLAQNGKICAAIYNSDFEVYHIIADSAEVLSQMQGAKYSQSKVEHCFTEIKKLLNKGTPVLFVGTPCQTAGLCVYLGRNYQDLLLVDMVCHGLPSTKVWQKYLQFRNKADAPESELCTVNLRSKSTGWSRYSYSVELEYSDGTRYCVPQGQDMFMRGFVSNLYLRPSCANCAFKGVQRCSDLTLGDYWGIWNQHPEFDDNKGTSLLLIHTEKGKRAWDRVSEQFRKLDVTVHESTIYNPSALSSFMPHPNREIFFGGLDSAKNLQQWIRHCLEPQKENLLQRLVRKISRN